jgi:PncC family amidohydrolase
MENTEELVVNLLIEKNYHISFAESITGGLCAAKLINVPNASMVLNESFVTYSNEAKMKYCDVAKQTIDLYGVVSEDVAYEMALGVAKNTGSEVGVGVTGIAGPTTDGTPIGNVCFGVSINGVCATQIISFKDIGRNNVRKSATDYVFEMIYNLLKA